MVFTRLLPRKNNLGLIPLSGINRDEFNFNKFNFFQINIFCLVRMIVKSK